MHGRRRLSSSSAISVLTSWAVSSAEFCLGTVKKIGLDKGLRLLGRESRFEATKNVSRMILDY